MLSDPIRPTSACWAYLDYVPLRLFRRTRTPVRPSCDNRRVGLLIALRGARGERSDPSAPPRAVTCLQSADPLPGNLRKVQLYKDQSCKEESLYFYAEALRVGSRADLHMQL